MKQEMKSMKQKIILPADLLISQLEDALEERQNPDRRKVQAGLPEGIEQDRRKGDRRAKKKS
ncbi:hypothetical protein [Saccharophagus sp. K07]|jgi:citrate lyase beta subunit|uniref:hypothetical protein n=1 Tax=Saccharophagus sp. K07 TaxID=2283636 RepID=UPI0016527D13|nr:hypothetical protein [Saccharophagus sp. K07]